MNLRRLIPLLAFGLLWPELLLAQDAAPPSGDVSLGQLWAQGGWAMYPLAGFSMCALALILYNALNVRPSTLLRPDVVEDLTRQLGAAQVDEARAYCAANPGIVANITAAGLVRTDPANYNPEAVEKAMEEASVEEVAGPFVFIGYLSQIGSLAPMIGMLGTVSGMIKAFRNIALGGMGKPELLADNISEALITTAVGLIVGIPAMIAYFYFKSRYQKLTSKIARICGDLHYTLTSALRR